MVYQNIVRIANIIALPKVQPMKESLGQFGSKKKLQDILEFFPNINLFWMPKGNKIANWSLNNNHTAFHPSEQFGTCIG